MPTQHKAPKLPTSFIWRINSPQGKFSGEQKAQLVERMEEISERISQGTALVEFSYDTGAVIGKISAKTNPTMKLRAKEQAQNTTTKGFLGFITRVLLLWHGAGKSAQSQLIEKMEIDFLQKEQAKATAQLLNAFKTIIAYSGQLADERDSTKAESRSNKTASQ